MPTIYRWGGFRFHFYSNESHEPPHVHVRRDSDSCKFWLDSVEVAYNEGMASHEITRLRAIVEERREEFLEKWNEFFSKDNPD